MNILRDKISDLQEKCADSKQLFYPFVELQNLLRNLLTLEEFCAALDQILEPRFNGRDLRRFASLIREDYIRIFATLVINQDAKYILQFLYRRETDSRLPFVENGLDFLPQAVARTFLQRQYEFNAVRLEYGAIHRQLRSEEILPFLSTTEIGEGGFGTVWRVEVHPTSHQLFISRSGMAKAHGRHLQVHTVRAPRIAKTTTLELIFL